jgi:hypothetical protein
VIRGNAIIHAAETRSPVRFTFGMRACLRTARRLRRALRRVSPHHSPPPRLPCLLTCPQVGDAGAAALGSALLSRDCALTDLDLGLNGIGDAGALALSKGLAVNAKLASLLLTGHPVSLRGVDEDHAGKRTARTTRTTRTTGTRRTTRTT